MERILKAGILVLSSLIFIMGSAAAQDPIQSQDTIPIKKKKKEKKVYCKCTIRGLPRGKFISVKYEYRPSFRINTTDKTNSFGNTSNTINNNGRVEIKVKIPIVNKPYLSIVGGLKYNKEEYNFKDKEANPLYKSLEDRALRSIGATLTVLKPMRSNKFWILRLAANLNGDYNNKTVSKGNYLKFSVSPALAWRKSDDLIYALGLTYSYSFGRELVFPTFGLNYNFNDQWSIESVLPLFVKFRYGFNENFYWYNNLEVDGSSYRLNNTEASLASYQSLHLHRSELKYSTSIEKQIVGWLWGGLEVGGAHNFSYNLTNSNSGRKDIIFKSKINEGFFASFSIFLVPPKRLYRKVTENL